MSEFDLLAAGAQGMARERELLEISARNVAASQASTPGHEYHRLVADFTEDPGLDAGDIEPRVRESSEPVDALAEMVSMLDAQRSYEADASIFDVGKRIAERAIDLGTLVNVTGLEPDAPLDENPAVTPLPDVSGRGTGFEGLVDVAGAALERADAAERAFAARRGGLVEMMIERTSADAMLQLATAAAQRTTQAISTLFGMQV